MNNKISIVSGKEIDLGSLIANAQAINITDIRLDDGGILEFNTGNMPVLVDPMFIFDVDLPSDPEESMKYFTLKMSASKGYRFQLIFYCEGDDISAGITIPVTRFDSMQEYTIDLAPLYARIFAKNKDKKITRAAMIPGNTNNLKIAIKSMCFYKDIAWALTEIIHDDIKKAKSNDPYIPEPSIAKTDYLIGAHYFPGWKHSTHEGWKVISPFPEKKPLLGFYDEGNPEVCDWEIKWALEHGISYFVYCWYGFPWTEKRGDHKFNALNHAIHDGLFNARFNSKFKFVINFCAHFGIKWLGDLADDLFPFWLETYFKHPSYLVVDNKPVLFILDFEHIIAETSLEKFRSDLKKMKAATQKAGFDGLSISGMYWGMEVSGIERLTEDGFDSGFAYMNWSRWNIVESKRRPKAKSFIDDQKQSIDIWMNSKIDFISAVSFMWDPISWYRPSNGGMLDILRWRITPCEYEEFLRWTKEQMDKQDKRKLASKMLLLDNWNEYGEGHYMAPHVEYGFEYLDAVRNVFTDMKSGAEHTHLLPGDIGRGPYETLYVESAEFRVFDYPPLVFDKDKLDMYLNA